jgi:hypothetical protein
MKPRISGLLGVLAALASAATACKKDPTADGVGTPAAVIADFSAFTLSVGDSAKFTASVVDERLTPLDAPITFSSCDNAAATVTVDPTYAPVPHTSARAVIHAVGPNAVCILASSGSAKPDTVHLIVLPVAFSGTISSTTPSAGSVIVIHSTAQLKFIPASVSVTFGGGFAGGVIGATADTVAVVVPFSDPAKLSIGGITLTYVAGSNVTLSTTGTVTQTGDFYNNADSSFATAPTLTIPAAAGQSTKFITNVINYDNAATQCAEGPGGGSTGPCMIYKFTLAAPASLKFSTDWAPGGAVTPDIDIYACDNTGLAGCFEDGGAGATASKPQTFTFTFPAGTHYFVIEDFDNSSSTRNITTTITHN